MTAYDTGGGNSSFDPLRGLKESLNALRVRHFFSTSQLAEETGLSIAEIDSVFKADLVPSWESLRRVLPKLGVDDPDIITMYRAHWEACTTPRPLVDRTPDPGPSYRRGGERTPANEQTFNTALARLRARSGISLREIARRMEEADAKTMMSKSALHNIFGNGRFPTNGQQVRTLLKVLVAAYEGDSDEVKMHFGTWQRIAETRSASGRQS
jgi:transcriptional regulator with XRE-family HTH domain